MWGPRPPNSVCAYKNISKNIHAAFWGGQTFKHICGLLCQRVSSSKWNSASGRTFDYLSPRLSLPIVINHGSVRRLGFRSRLEALTSLSLPSKFYNCKRHKPWVPLIVQFVWRNAVPSRAHCQRMCSESTIQPSATFNKLLRWWYLPVSVLVFKLQLLGGGGAKSRIRNPSIYWFSSSWEEKSSLRPIKGTELLVLLPPSNSRM